MLLNQIGGKTGTTQNNANGWFIGVAPNLVGGVWTGGEDQSIHFETLSEGQGAALALPIFAMFLRKVYDDPQFGIMESDEFERPLISILKWIATRQKKKIPEGEDISGRNIKKPGTRCSKLSAEKRAYQGLHLTNLNHFNVSSLI